MALAAPAPANVVWEKLADSRTFLFKYQFRPADQAVAFVAEVAGLAKFGSALSSMSSEPYRPPNSQAPQPPVEGPNRRHGCTPASAASSPVNTHDPVLCH